ncbi:MAG: YesL family protein [Chloroflexota bacterium]
MRAFFGTLFNWLVEAFDSFFELMVWNLLWLVFTLLVVTAPPASAALYYATNRLAHGQRANWRDFFTGLRQHFWLGWRWGLLNLVIIFVLLSNYIFYGSFEGGWVSWVQGVFLALIFLWLLLQIFTFPLLLEQQDQRLRTALRNSLVFYVKRPGFCLGVGLTSLVLIILSTTLLVPAWVVITASLCAYLANRAALHLIEELDARSTPPDEPRAPA